MRAIRHVIWDFNGTLIDDVDCCVDTLNTLLASELTADLACQYLATFGFPVRAFYVELGFDFEREDFDSSRHLQCSAITPAVSGRGPQEGCERRIAGDAAPRRSCSRCIGVEQPCCNACCGTSRCTSHGPCPRPRPQRASSKVQLGLTCGASCWPARRDPAGRRHLARSRAAAHWAAVLAVRARTPGRRAPGRERGARCRIARPSPAAIDRAVAPSMKVLRFVLRSAGRAARMACSAPPARPSTGV